MAALVWTVVGGQGVAAAPLVQLVTVKAMDFVLMKLVVMVFLWITSISQVTVGWAQRTHAMRTLSGTAETWTWRSRPRISEGVEDPASQ